MTTLHSVVETAKLLGVSKWTVYRYIQAGDLDATDVRPTGSLRPRTKVPSDSINAFIASRTRNAKTLRTA